MLNILKKKHILKKELILKKKQILEKKHILKKKHAEKETIQGRRNSGALGVLGLTLQVT